MQFLEILKLENGFDGYRDVFAVYAIPTEKNDEFMEIIGLTEKDLLGQNEKIYIVSKNMRTIGTARVLHR